MAYAKIYNLYKDRDIMLFRECYAMEKIDGTSAHITWDGENVSFFAGGSKHERFIELFDAAALAIVFNELFGLGKVKVYGEAYGGKIQGMSKTYGPDLKFVAFEVLVGDTWLSVPNAHDVVTKLSLEFVFYNKISTDVEAIDAQRDADSIQAIRNGMGHGHIREGVILRPLIEMTKSNGRRIMSKHKRPEFAERQKQPKVQDPEELKLIEGAEAAAREFVVVERMRHVVAKMKVEDSLTEVDMTCTGTVIKRMINDIMTEAEGEVLDDKRTRKAIGKEAALLFKRMVSNLEFSA